MTASKGSEKSIQSKIVAYLKTKVSSWYVKNVANIHSRAGLPDLFFARNGFFYAFEVKTEKGKVSQRQQAELSAMQRAGLLTAVVRNVDDVKAILNSERRIITYRAADSETTAIFFDNVAPPASTTGAHELEEIRQRLSLLASLLECQATITFYKRK